MSLSDVIVALSNLNPSKVTLIPILMQILVHSGIFNHNKQQGDSYSLTNVGRFFVENNPCNKRSYFLLFQHPVMLKMANSMSNWLQDDLPTAFETAHGKSPWDYCIEKPEFSAIVDDGMASDSGLFSKLLISDCCRGVFEGLTSLVDVGGGTGTMATAIAGAFPSLKCIVLDLPHVTGERKGTGNLEFVAGNMFDKIPQANAIFLKWILHTWNDEDCAIGVTYGKFLGYLVNRQGMNVDPAKAKAAGNEYLSLTGIECFHIPPGRKSYIE